ncbi:MULTISPECIES: response regulator transcription factor [Paenibacillus]|uniref:response regulator transcription factor n=1 Tax=Paenibacillus TaxID=44249 RepID=UPI000AC932E2|nr:MULTISPECIES: response regulator transcription factor [Paenibacillus]MDF9839578.1 DNA-binding response OmpR family regulator [Paenibacillus sp. PastF-2]MDF9846159.1 DNA-binding response OmpR family regulator [Paenibacillus sp. PastM-2]MDF9852731.1 DNA-binding response OmpR family regulator [Paenibacillus sp. PastF-1]MDH6373161.1 DNA-binding response OmpR family regulator [Paenibacillus sp. PastF-3]MDH6477539.1 DNA-binding response OmpR family regulator [Paenibacillus sp. PastH-2]
MKGKTVLVIEDDAKIRKLIRLYLENEGYEVFEAKDGREGKEVFEKLDPCFVITDLILPHVSGEEICQWIRSDQNSDVPLMILTAKVEESERIWGLQMGADDYVTKPFSPKEVVVRVETILRRTANRCSKISYRGLTLKPLRGEAKYDGKIVPLTNHEFQLLYFFLRHPNQVLNRNQILQELYPYEEKQVIDRTIDVHVSKLREKLNGAGASSDMIDTIRGMGYRFNGYE